MADAILELLADLMKEYPGQQPQIAYLDNDARGVYVLPEFPKAISIHHKELAEAMDVAGANGAELAVVMYTSSSETVRMRFLFKPRPIHGISMILIPRGFRSHASSIGVTSPSTYSALIGGSNRK